MRLITARSSASRNSRGFGLPACGRGVSVPTSTKPKPKPSICAETSASLSKPAASPTGLGKSSPATSIAEHRDRAAAGMPGGSSFSARIVSRCARSASSAKARGRTRG